jgi:two-component system, NtrC family, sensor kinase
MGAVFGRVRRLIGDLPLRPTIAAALLVGLALPVGLAVWRDLADRRASLLEHLVSDHQRLADVLAIGMATPIWEVRPDTGQPLIDAVMRDERVVEVSVTAPLLPHFLEASAPERRHGELISLEQSILRSGEEIGRVRLSMSTGPLDAEVRRQGGQVLLTGLLQLAFGLLLLFPLLRLKVLDPLRRLVGLSRALAGGDLEQRGDWRRRDELGMLGRSFEETRLSLRRLIGDLETTNRDLRQREAELSGQTRLLRATLDHMTDGITLVDADLRLKAWNDRFREVLDFPPEVIRADMPITELHVYDVARAGTRHG